MTIPANDTREVASLSNLPPGIYLVKGVVTVNQSSSIRINNLKLSIFTDNGNGTERLAQQQNQDTENREEHSYTLTTFINLIQTTWLALHVSVTGGAITTVNYMDAVRIK